MSSVEHLLTPTLSRQQVLKPLYSAQSHFFVAFFGGPFAILLFGLYNIYHSGLLKRFQYWYLGLLLAVVISQVLLAWFAIHGFPFQIEVELTLNNLLRWGNKLFGLGLMGLIYLVQKEEFAVSQMKDEAPSPWVPGLTCFGIGWVYGLALLWWVSHYVA